jgi:glyoxylase-like metal-dependent hydrolase (beta-lactamase superfamily II)/rhodanese-related sulfurtransferase
LGAGKTCAIVDPRRDVQIYLDAAQNLGLRITHILETHLHADFISGHIDLAEATGARIYGPASAKLAFEHVALQEGDTVRLENIELRVMETPGHTPEHIVYVAVDRGRAPDPVGVFTGDTLFVGDVGRPDLFPGRAQELASRLYDSLHSKLLALPDYCEVYPAHGAGSLCGRAMGAKRTSTIGYERRYNSALQISDRDEFIASLTTDMPLAPDHFSRCSAINGQGPTPLNALPSLQALPPRAFAERAQDDHLVILDVRDYGPFGANHVPASWHVSRSANYSTFAGWLLPDAPILLVCDSRQEAEGAALGLQRVGLDGSFAYLEGGMQAWAVAGLPMAHVGQVSVPELHALMTAGDEAVVLVDVRAPSEFDAVHIKGAINIELPELRTRHGELDPEKRTILTCGSGQRASMGTAILKRHGFADVHNAAGGMNGYNAAGYAPACPMCVLPHVSRYLG